MSAKKQPAPPPPVLDPEQAGVLLKANYRNLAKKVQAGKTLSASEINLLEGLKGGTEAEKKTHAADQAELARILGVSRKTIQRAIKSGDSPGAKTNGSLEIAAWRGYFAARGTLDDRDASLSQTQLKARQILLQNQKLEFQLSVMRRDFVPSEDVEKWGAELGAAIRKIVTQIHLVAPSVVGCTTPEAESRLKDLEDEILSQLHTLGARMEAWKNDSTR